MSGVTSFRTPAWNVPILRDMTLSHEPNRSSRKDRACHSEYVPRRSADNFLTSCDRNQTRTLPQRCPRRGHQSLSTHVTEASRHHRKFLPLRSEDVDQECTFPRSNLAGNWSKAVSEVGATVNRDFMNPSERLKKNSILRDHRGKFNAMLRRFSDKCGQWNKSRPFKNRKSHFSGSWGNFRS